MSGQLALVVPPAADRSAQLVVERDRTLEALQHGRRREVIALAHAVAVELAQASCDGCVTSPLVLDEMRRRGLLTAEESADARFLGGCFPGGRGDNARWVRVGYANTGSKARPVSVWRQR